MVQTSQQNDLSWEKIDSNKRASGVTFEVGRTEYKVAAKANMEEAAKHGKEFLGTFEGKNSFDIQGNRR